MNHVEYILATISEEAGEIVQAVGKIQRFGLYDHLHINPANNLEDLQTEVHDLIAMYEILCQALNINPDINPDKLKAKKNKFSRYTEHSRNVGTLQP